jgi:hypothetical protein
LTWIKPLWGLFEIALNMNEDDVTVTTGELAKLFDTMPKTIADLAKREIIVPAGKRGRWRLEPSVSPTPGT